MDQVRICDIHAGKISLGEYSFNGWVKTHRQSKNVSFIELSDGSSVKGLQLVLEPALESYAACASEITTGAAISVKGQLVESPAKGQSHEFQVGEIELVGTSSEDYPLQKKGHTLEFLREILHLRPRSNTLGAAFRVRSKAAMAIHEFFQERGFVYAHTPIITTSDGEGAGEMFRVTTLDLGEPPRDDKGEIDFGQDFFKEAAGLTVTGQLEAEVFACSLMNTYTFGPTFRAENSNTVRHLSEFWMIEPEMAFCDLQGNMKLAEEFVRYILKYTLENCQADLEFLYQREWVEKGLQDALEKLVDAEFTALDYTEAIKILENCNEKFEFPVKWGMDLQAEHEKYLTDKHIQGPVFIINYPKEIKAFYMKLNEDDKTVAAMDLLVPRLGEIIGGSQREERHDVLKNKIIDGGLDLAPYEWYLEMRKYGTVPHSGFGLGFERFLMYVTGIQNIRDVTPFPRHPGYAKF